MQKRTMWGTVTIDPETNLPELPDGLFWKVTRFSGGSAYIQLRKVRPFWFSEVIEWTTVSSRDFTQDGVIVQAAYVLYKLNRTFNEILGVDEKNPSTQVKLSGSYRKKGRA